jgi:hypothetical protein
VKKIRGAPLIEQFAFVIQISQLCWQVGGVGSIVTSQGLDDLRIRPAGISAKTLAKVPNVERDVIRFLFAESRRRHHILRSTQWCGRRYDRRWLIDGGGCFWRW